MPAIHSILKYILGMAGSGVILSVTVPPESAAGPNYIIWVVVAIAVIAVAYFAVVRKKSVVKKK